MGSIQANRELRKASCASRLADCLKKGSPRERPDLTLENEARTRCEVLAGRKCWREPCPR
jgi:hypothetical protein